MNSSHQSFKPSWEHHRAMCRLVSKGIGAWHPSTATLQAVCELADYYSFVHFQSRHTLGFALGAYLVSGSRFQCAHIYGLHDVIRMLVHSNSVSLCRCALLIHWITRPIRKVDCLNCIQSKREGELNGTSKFAEIHLQFATAFATANGEAK